VGQAVTVLPTEAPIPFRNWQAIIFTGLEKPSEYNDSCMTKKLTFPKVFFGVFFHPRETTRAVIKQKYFSFILPLVILYSLITELDPTFPIIFSRFMPLIASVFLSVLITFGLSFGSYFLFAWLLFRIGKKLKGKGNLQQIQAAYALVYIPCLIMLILRTISEIPAWTSLISNRDNLGQLNTRELSDQINSAGMVAHSPLIALLIFVFCVWMIFPWIINISEAHKYSKWQAFKTHLAVIGLLISALIGLFIIIAAVIVLSKLL
jgi:hypothetical protein